ncbi:hypothetical protein BDF21DRAFT_487291 [Thamnidium elegans]|nr:hypothetical protein BDF21DRAFT_487291 [Thamnidium elegans]
MASKKCDDSTIQLLYNVANQIFETDIITEGKAANTLLSIWEQEQKQFSKIEEKSDINNLEESKKRTRDCANDGYLCFELCKKRFEFTLDKLIR